MTSFRLDTQKTLKELGLKPTGGQHFLDTEIGVEKLLDNSDTHGKTVLEIGAGTGNITEEVDAEKIYAVEKDTVLANYLESQDLADGVFNEDFLEMEIPEDVDYVVGNLPFEITSDILEKIGKIQLPATFIVQEELADKVVADPGDSEYGYFSFLMDYYFLPVKIGLISASNYYPEPEVDTAVLRLYPNKERHGVEKEEEFLDFAKALFTHKRKKLRNAFVDARNILGITKDQAKELRDELPNSEKRVSKMEIIEIKEAYEKFSDKIQN